MILLIFAFGLQVIQCTSFSSLWKEYKHWHQDGIKQFDLDFADPSISERRYLIYTSDDRITLERRWMGCAAALLYSVLTDRILVIDKNTMNARMFPGLQQFMKSISKNEIEFKSKMPSSKMIGPRGMEKMELISNQMDNVEEIRLFGCSSAHNDHRVQFLVLDSPDYFVPLLSLNEEYKDRILEWFPHRQVLADLSEIMLERSFPQQTNVNQYSLIFDEDYYSPGLDHNVKHHLRNVSVAKVFIMSNKQQHFGQFAQNQKFTVPRLSKQYKTGQNTDGNRLEDILTAIQNSTVLMTAESALGELVGALTRQPPLVISNTPCNRPSCSSCRPMRASDACYGRASLKAFVSNCIGSFSGNYQYYDMFTRPDHIDACKSRVIGMQIVYDERSDTTMTQNVVNQNEDTDIKTKLDIMNIKV